MPSTPRIQVPEDCIARCQAGDRQAFHALFLGTCAHVQRILVRLVGGRASDLDDLVQEVYLGLWRALPAFRGEAALSSYIYGICLRVAKKRGRGWFRFTRLREALAREPRPDATPASEVGRDGATAAAVQRTLDGMSFKLRSVLVLHEMEELSGKEIAAQLGIPEKTVWTRLHHARKVFRRSYPWNEDERPPPPAPSPG